MTYLLRENVCSRLRLSIRQSYRIVGVSNSNRIASDEIVDILNRARRAIEKPLEYVPSDLATPEEIVNDMGESQISLRELRAWTHRTKNIVPHFRLNGHTIRFSRALLNKWLENQTKVRSRV